MAFELSGSKLSPRSQLILLTLLMAGLCYVFYSQYIQSLRLEVEVLEKKSLELQTDVQKGQIVYQRLPLFKKQVQEQEIRLTTLRKILPERKETGEIVRRVVQLAEQSRLKIKSFEPKKSNRRDFFEEWPIMLSMEGSYDNLGTFFEKVSRFTRIINVDNIAIKRAEVQARNLTLSATCTATTFVFVEPTVSVKATKKKPKKGI